MNINKLTLIYFSATYSTQKIVRSIASGISTETTEEFDITRAKQEALTFKSDELVIIGVPVYSGRVPQTALQSLHQFKGKKTPVIIVAVYGNREYDDALLELKNITQCNGFKVISAAAFIAKHCIFPKIASDRPTIEDLRVASNFGQKSLELLANIESVDSLQEIVVKGNFPYREAKNIPLTPKGNNKCNQCNLCVQLCPTNAIDESNPRKTNKKKCIACARCISICPQKARHFGGLLYTLVEKSFVKKNSERKDIEIIYATKN